MDGVITSMTALQAKFNRDGYAFWNLYGADGKTMMASNRKGGKGDIQDSWNLLAANLEELNNPDGRLFRLQTFPQEGSTHGYTVGIQIYNSQQNANTAVAGIGSMPSMGIGSIQELVNTQVTIARLEMENERLQDALEYAEKPSPWAEVLNPKTVQAVIAGILQAVNPNDKLAMPVNGTPAYQSEAPVQVADDGDEDSDEFYKLADETADLLGVDDITMMRKLHALVKAQPEMAKTLLND